MRSFAAASGLVALVLAMLVGFLALTGIFGRGASPDTSSAVSPEATGGQPEQRVARPTVPVGRTVTAGELSWTVTEARRESELRAYTFPPNTIPGNFVTLTFTVENTSEKPVTLTADSILLLDSSGMEYQPEPDLNNTFVQPEQNLLFSEFGLIEPGATREGRANFGVLAGSSGFVAELGDTDPTLEEEKYVDLGF